MWTRIALCAATHSILSHAAHATSTTSLVNDGVCVCDTVTMWMWAWAWVFAQCYDCNLGWECQMTIRQCCIAVNPWYICIMRIQWSTCWDQHGWQVLAQQRYGKTMPYCGSRHLNIQQANVTCTGTAPCTIVWGRIKLNVDASNMWTRIALSAAIRSILSRSTCNKFNLTGEWWLLMVCVWHCHNVDVDMSMSVCPM